MQFASNILCLHALNFLKMRVVHKKRQIEQKVALLKKEQQTIGFVPTMGALHQGHLALVHAARAQNDHVIVSIFVNPTQFNTNNDLINYPRTLDSDVSLLQKISDDIIVFAPDPEDIYGAEVRSKTYNFQGLELEMEGKYRPGHFDGVATVVQLLFSSIQPTHAYFGEKDFQQLQIIKKMAAIEKMAVHIVECPIQRETNGLALSSRNKRLSEPELAAAPFIYKTLTQVKKDFGTKNATTIKAWVIDQFETQELLKLEYFEITERTTLKPMAEKQNDKKYRAFIAVFAGEVRLIDNIALN